MSNRREFVAAATGGAMLASLGVASTSALACNGAVARRVGGSPSLASFQSLQGEELLLVGADGRRAALRIHAVQDNSVQAAVEQFTLVLRGNAGRALAGDIYVVDNAQSGRFAMRLEPAGQDAKGRLYRAEFSLMV